MKLEDRRYEDVKLMLDAIETVKFALGVIQSHREDLSDWMADWKGRRWTGSLGL